MKILNLYSGIGGNRKLWGNENEITAVEWDSEIAKIYQDFFPNDKVIVADAHEYLLRHYGEYDFIWSSPPCPSHSRINKSNHLSPYKDNTAQIKHGGGIIPRYPDMGLYQEIIFLQHFFKGKWCVENVIPYYKPLIPATKIQRHLFWSNFPIEVKQFETDDISNSGNKTRQYRLGFDISGYKIKERKDKVLRNCVFPPLGLYILNQSKLNNP